MGEVEVEFHTLGAMQYRDLARKFRQVGSQGGVLRKQLRKRIAEAGKPVVEEVKQAARDIPVKGTPGGGSLQRRRDAVLRARSVRGALRAAGGSHSLRRALASAISLRTVNSGIYIVLKASRMAEGQETLPRHMNSEKGWRHPVFGDREEWVHQAGHPFFDVTIRKREAEFRRACEQAIQDALDTLR